MKYAAIAALIAVVSAADCPETYKLEYFSDKKCETKDKDVDAVEATAEHKKWLKKGGCIKKGADSVKMECDAKGITMTAYTASTECKAVEDGTEPKPTKFEYSSCKSTEEEGHNVYVKLTGAAALKAAAIALVAIAGSQF